MRIRQLLGPPVGARRTQKLSKEDLWWVEPTRVAARLNAGDEGTRRLADREVDVSGQHILIEGGRAAVGHQLEARTGTLLEVDTGDHPAPADANCACHRLTGAFFQPGDQFP